MSRKYSASAYAQIDPAYELMDNGMVRHRASLMVRPKIYSGLPVPFVKDDEVKVVDGTSQFPVGTVYRIHAIEGDVVYVHELGRTTAHPICWERLDRTEACIARHAGRA